MNALFDLVRQIPAGRCSGYGDLGRALEHPVSGLVVGRWMAHCPPDVPWWRVVAADGRLPVHKLDPRLAQEQRQRLEDEGVPFEGENVVMSLVHWDEFA